MNENSLVQMLGRGRLYITNAMQIAGSVSDTNDEWHLGHKSNNPMFYILIHESGIALSPHHIQRMVVHTPYPEEGNMHIVL